MRTFILLWLGQIISSVSSHMTYFALTLWVWQQTESATAVALILFFYQLPQSEIALFSGLLVDRVSRKTLLILSDTASACCTISVGILAMTQMLQVWHLYVIAAIIGSFGHIEPAMITHRLLGFGSGAGAGMAVLYTACALAMVLVGIGGFLLPGPKLREFDA